MIRLATEKDLDTINEIYNYEVLNSEYNVDTCAVTSEERLNWFAYHQTKNLPILVKDRGGTGEIIAWASLNEWAAQGGYNKTAEVSIFVDRNVHRQGLGKELLRALMDSGAELGYKVLISRTVKGNTASLKLHQSLNFRYIGIMRRVAFKLGKWVDVQIWQKDLFI
ncbi:hypothetical protein BKI52_33870 [marine bacterium AO1-C]|nr:hypothetical protein BKI52_33870 [marine bacterium AO1-C]